MMKILVVYYSRSGFTKKVANKIAETLSADIEQLIDKNKRKGFFGFLFSGYEAVTKKEAKILPLEKDPQDYELVIVCSPVWAGSLSSPIRTFLNRSKEKIKNIAFVATYKAAAERIFEQMEQISKKPIATLGISENEIKSAGFESLINSFVNKLNQKGS